MSFGASASHQADSFQAGRARPASWGTRVLLLDPVIGAATLLAHPGANGLSDYPQRQSRADTFARTYRGVRKPVRMGPRQLVQCNEVAQAFMSGLSEERAGGA